MCETKKVVNSNESLIEMLQAGEKYFVNRETWTAKGVQKFMDQYELLEMEQMQIKAMYSGLVVELSGLSEVTGQVVHNYCVAWTLIFPFRWTWYLPASKRSFLRNKRRL